MYFVTLWSGGNSLPFTSCPLQPQGLLRAEGGLQPRLFIDSSTILPTYSTALEGIIAKQPLAHESAGAAQGARAMFVDAPVSGGVPGATQATLTFMVRV
jgi:3-hydroxyisobutyrate dehydrogenase-like beta-hydroxyacid dehydrogenase